MPAKITIEIDDARALGALDRLGKGVERPAPALKAIGELLVESTKQRFAASSAPDGSRWLPNAPATFEAYLNKPETRGKNFRQDGRLSAKGATRAANKKPLVDSGLLAVGSSPRAWGTRSILFPRGGCFLWERLKAEVHPRSS